MVKLIRNLTREARDQCQLCHYETLESLARMSYLSTLPNNSKPAGTLSTCRCGILLSPGTYVLCLGTMSISLRIRDLYFHLFLHSQDILANERSRESQCLVLLCHPDAPRVSNMADSSLL
jgi:hypothetical protein